MNSLLATLTTLFYHVSSAPRRVTLHTIFEALDNFVVILGFILYLLFGHFLTWPRSICFVLHLDMFAYYRFIPTYVGILRRSIPKFFALATSFSDLLQGQTCQSTIPISWSGSSLRDKALRTLKDKCMTPSLGWPDFFKLVIIETDSHTVIGNIPIHHVGTQFVTWIGFY